MSAPARGYGWLLAWLVPVVVSFAVRGLFPIDETRYVAVAWEMWTHDTFLVPHLNGAPYSHKPPLLFWLFHGGWWLFGVTEWWPRLVPPLFALGSLLALPPLARHLWPERPAVADLAPWLLAGGFFWALFTPTTMFDMVLTAMVVGAIAALLAVAAGRPRTGWSLFAAACGLGILVKGPVMLLHVAGPALLGPWWAVRARQQPGRWYAGLVLALAGGAAVALAWALPAAQSGGTAYEQAILWHQTADRLANSFAHDRPWWWYLPLLPLLLFPWFVWPPHWRGLRALRGRGSEQGIRLGLAWLLPTFAAFSVIGGKQAHYLLPLFPAAALIGARGLDELARGEGGWSEGRLAWVLPAAGIAALGVLLAAIPWLPLGDKAAWLGRIQPLWGVPLLLLAWLISRWEGGSARGAVVGLAVATAVTVSTLYGGLSTAAGSAYAMGPAGRYLADLQRSDLAVAHVGDYDGQYHFAGRLRRPLQVLEGSELEAWAAAHPDGYVVEYRDTRPLVRVGHVQPYRGGWLMIRRVHAGDSPADPSARRASAARE